MSFTIQLRQYAYDNITAGNAAGQERNQSQFFPYTPGNVDPVSGSERVFDPTSSTQYTLNAERSGNTSPAAWGYGKELP